MARRRKGMSIPKFRGGLYTFARILGDIQALSTGRIFRRIGRRLGGKLTGRGLRSIFK